MIEFLFIGKDGKPTIIAVCLVIFSLVIAINCSHVFVQNVSKIGNQICGDMSQKIVKYVCYFIYAFIICLLIDFFNGTCDRFLYLDNCEINKSLQFGIRIFGHMFNCLPIVWGYCVFLGCECMRKRIC